MTDTELLLAISDIFEKKLDTSLKPIYNRLDRIEERLDRIEIRLDSLEGRVTNLEHEHAAFDNRLKRIEIDLLENNVIPRLSTMEACYLGTYCRYQDSFELIENVYEDNKLIKSIVAEHSERLQALESV
ncbi:MAG TPA: hypothetical protein VJZ01_00055 [Lachnospiraceae bacterium]|jgi:archaellum component FlaC|nr:hypothetical protein [Lachnospiraceae bacterium]